MMANDETAVVAQLYFKPGERVKPGDVLMDLETSKAAFALNAESGGFIEYLCCEGDEVKIAQPVIRIYDEAPVVISKAKSENKSLKQPGNNTRFSQSAEALIVKHGIDRHIFDGRDLVSAEDVKTILEADHVEFRKIGTAKKAEIAYLSDVQSAGLNSNVSVLVETDGLPILSHDYMGVFKDSFLTITIYEAARLLKHYPELNGYFAGNSIAHYKRVHIGVAIDINDGLKMVKIPDADMKNLDQVRNEFFELMMKYLRKVLAPEEMFGTTFSITDLSAERVHSFTPLINQKQSAVLGISGTDEKLRRKTITLTFDHRVTEGKRAGQFLNELKTKIESYRKQ